MELILTAPEGDTRRRYALGNGETVIGRRPDCDIVLDAPSIPERHARLFALDGYVVIRALDSHWPVYVNGEPIDRRPLAHGDEIELGHYRLRCDMQPGDRETGNEAAGPPAITDLTSDTEVPVVEEAAADNDSGSELRAGATLDNTETDATDPLAAGVGIPAETDSADPTESEDPLHATAPVQRLEPVDDADDFGTGPHTADRSKGGMPGADVPIPDVWTDARREADAAETRATPPDPAVLPPQGATDRRASTRDALDDPGPDNTSMDSTSAVEPAGQFEPGSGAATATRVPSPEPPSTRDRQEDRQPQTSGRAEPDAGTQYHLDILSGINAGRRVTLETDRAVLGFNRQRLVEIHNDNGRLSLRRADEDSVAHLNGVPISDEPATGGPGDIISVQRIELRIGVGG